MTQDAEDFKTPAVLLIAEPSPTRDLISAYLTMMGCNMKLAGEEELHLIDPDSFDTIVIHRLSSQVAIEKFASAFCPVASEKTLVITARVADPRVLELARSHGLRTIPEELWPQQLWPAIQEVLAAAQSSRMSHDVQIAQLVFDSFRLPALSGVRAARVVARQLVYKQENATIDILIEPKEESGRIWLAGQVLDSSRAAGRGGLAVLLVDQTKTLAQTTTNNHGEFSLDFESRDATALQIRLRDRRWTSLPLESADWIATRLGGSRPSLAAEEKQAPVGGPVLTSQAKEQGNGK